MQPTAADIRNAALLSVATVAAGFVVPVFPYVAFPLAGFALGWLTYRFGAVPASLLALVSAALVAVFGPALLGTAPWDGAYVAVSLMAAGPGAALALRRFPAVNVAAFVTMAVTAAFLVSPLGAALLRESVALWKEVFRVAPTTWKIADPVAFKAVAAQMLLQMQSTWPGSSFLTMGIGVAIGVSLAGRAGRALGLNVHRYGALADLDISFHVVWPTIVALGAAAAAGLWSGAPAILRPIGDNLLMMVRPFLFIQGAAVFAALYRRMNAGRVTKVIGFVLLLATEGLVPSVSIFGLVDLFANLRKLPRTGEPVPSVVV